MALGYVVFVYSMALRDHICAAICFGRTSNLTFPRLVWVVHFFNSLLLIRMFPGMHNP